MYDQGVMLGIVIGMPFTALRCNPIIFIANSDEAVLYGIEEYANSRSAKQIDHSNEGMVVTFEFLFQRR